MTVYVVLVLLIGSVVTYLIVPQPTGSGSVARRSAWSAALGFFAAVPIAYLVHGRRRSRSSGRCSAEPTDAVVGDEPHHFPDRPSQIGLVATDRFAVRSAAHSSRRGPVIRSAPSSFEGSRVSTDEQHIALPQLYGAPAYARPPAARRRRRATVRPRRAPDRGVPDRRGARVQPRRSRRAPTHRAACALGQQDAGSTTDAGSSLAIRDRSVCRRITGGSSAGADDLGPARRTGVASPDGGVAQSVRAAGLYPAGSRFESWLPYQPIPDRDSASAVSGDVARPRRGPAPAGGRGGRRSGCAGAAVPRTRRGSGRA